MNDFYYPPLTAAGVTDVLSAIEQAKSHVGYFGPECPWSPAIIAALRGLLPNGSTKAGGSGYLNHPGTKWEALEAETLELYQQISSLSEVLDEDDSTAKFQALKTKAQMLKSVIEMNERAKGLAHLNRFQQAVIDAMEQVLDVDQRVTIIEKLKACISGDAA